VLVAPVPIFVFSCAMLITEKDYGSLCVPQELSRRHSCQ